MGDPITLKGISFSLLTVLSSKTKETFGVRGQRLDQSEGVLVSSCVLFKMKKYKNRTVLSPPFTGHY